MIQCVAIDDEPLALAQITAYIAKTPFLNLVADCPNAVQAMEVMADEKVDLLFVDIQMPDVTGLEFVRGLYQKPLVIFTTAYSEYALEGFKADAIDYLLKPIGYPDFLRSAEKAYRQFKLLGNESPTEDNQQYLFVKSDYKWVKIDIRTITHIESQNEYIRIYKDDGTRVMTLGSLKSIDQRLPQGEFMRIHRSYIVNLHKITAIDRNLVHLVNGIQVPSGDQYRDAFETYLQAHAWGKK